MVVVVVAVHRIFANGESLAGRGGSSRRLPSSRTLAVGGPGELCVAAALLAAHAVVSLLILC